MNFRKSHKASGSMALQCDLYNRISDGGGGGATGALSSTKYLPTSGYLLTVDSPVYFLEKLGLSNFYELIVVQTNPIIMLPITQGKHIILLPITQGKHIIILFIP